MITKFRLYESVNEGKPKVGDYVICTTEFNPDLNLYLDENIGQIIEIDPPGNSYEPYQVIFDNIPKSLDIYTDVKINNFETYQTYIPFTISEIIYWYNDKKILEQILITKKFNI